MKTLLLFLTFISLSYAEGIDSLLTDYTKESELSNKTKDESAGSLIVYTRDDLERMQAETLKDILKSLRIFPYAENRTARPDIMSQDPLPYYSKSVRVYLNETELLTSVTGSGFILFGDMEMDFIDHVEIYQGFPSFDFGVEPATIVIRLYSKNSEHDEGGRVKLTVGSNGSNKQNVYYSDKEDEISYFMYANHTGKKQDTYEHHDETVARDKETNRFYGSIGTQNHTLELHAMKETGDTFLGSLVGFTPQDSSSKVSFINLSTSSKFFDKSLTLNLSYIDNTTNFKYNYDATNPNNIAPLSFFEQELKEEAFTTSLKKEWKLDAHTMTAGLQYRYKHFDTSNVVLVPPLLPIAPQSYDTENIYSVFLEDSISLNDTNLITLSVMSQLYKREKTIKDENLLQMRLGYIYSDKNWVSKTFLSSQEFASEPYMVLHTTNELSAESFISLLQEISYETSKTLSKLVFVYSKNENLLIVDENSPYLQVINSDLESDLYNATAEFTYKFSQKDKLELQANYFNMSSPQDGQKMEHYHYVARMLNTIGKFDIYNEFIINSGYTKVDTGYNYSLGVKYEVNRDFHISLKGDNIFNSGLEWNYLTPTSENSPHSINVPVTEQQFMLGMEYLF